MEEQTTLEQAAIYRLSGDYNPLHIDPQFSSMGGFPKPSKFSFSFADLNQCSYVPVLHGLCSMGIAGKHVLKTFGEYEDIKVRFAGIVIPGQTLVTEMWKEGDKVIFGESHHRIAVEEDWAVILMLIAAKVKETGKPALSNAAVTLKQGAKAKL